MGGISHCPHTTVPLGRQTIISTGKLYFSRCRLASSLWVALCGLFCGDNGHSLGVWAPSRVPKVVLTHFPLTCKSSSSFTKDQVLMKLSLRRARMGELSRTVSRRVRPEPVQSEENRVIPSLHPSLSFWDFQQAVSIKDYGDPQISV